MAFCSSCGAQLPEGASFCPACSRSTGSTPAGAAAPAPAAGGLTDNVAGMLAYITIIPAIIFLVMEPYNRNRFVRFHSFQCIFFCVACVVASIVLGILGNMPFLGWFTVLLWPLLGLAEVIIWVILLINIGVVLYIAWVRWDEIKLRSERHRAPARFVEHGD